MNNTVKTIVLLVVAFVVLAILFPIVLDQAAAITGHTSIDDFTGLEAFVNLTPLLMWLSAVFGLLGYGGFMAVKAYRSRSSRRRSPRRGA